MENAKYSPSTGGIYPAAVYKEFPPDALDIPPALYQRHLDGLTCGAFDVVNGVVVEYSPPARTLEQLKAANWEAIKSERDRRKAGGVKVTIDLADYWFHSDDPSRIQYGILDGKATRLGWPDTVELHPEWKTMSGAKVPMTVARLRQVIDLGISLEMSVFAAGETHRSAMEASADPANYDFSTGWPLTFGG